MGKRWGWCLCFLILGLPAWAQQAFIQGQVTNAQQQPLVGATISLQTSANAALTDSQGKFKLTVEPNKEYTLWVTYIGFLRFERKLTLLPGETRYLSIELSAKASELQAIEVTSKHANDTREVASITKIDPTDPSTAQPFSGV